MLASVQIIPARLLGEIDRAVASLIVAYGTGHQGRTKHPLVLDIVYLSVAIEVHHQATHHGIVLGVYPASHRVEVRHEAVAQLVVIDKRLVGRMIVGSNVPDFTQRPLTMNAEQGDEGAKLTPTGLQLAPLLEVLVLYLGTVVQLLGLHITVLDTEATLVHAPEGQSGHRIVQTCRHLSTHILPTGTDVTTPCGRRVALLASKTTTRQQEDTLVRIDRALTVIDSIGIDDAVGIEILR